MARPEKNNVEYFPHPVTHGKKMFYLRSKYGNDGYAVWFMLLEELGDANYHYLDLKDEVQLMYLSSKIMVSEDILMEVISILVKFSEFDKELWKEQILFSQKFIDTIQDAYKKRTNKCTTKDELIDRLIGLGRLKPSLRTLKVPIKPQSKVKYSKVKETISQREIFSLHEIFYFKNYKFYKKVTDNFIAHYEKTGWKDKNGNPIENRMAAARQWKDFEHKTRLAPEKLLLKWQECYEVLKNELQDNVVSFLSLVPRQIDGDGIVFSGSIDDIKYLEEKYVQQFGSAIKSVFGPGAKVYYDNHR